MKIIRQQKEEQQTWSVFSEGNRVECHGIVNYWHLDERKKRSFKRIHYHYFSIRKKGGEYKKENLYIENGILFVDDVMIYNEWDHWESVSTSSEISIYQRQNEN